MLPRISVVVPSYNQGRFLGATLKSLFGQDYPHLEVLLLDGGSQDETLDVIKQYQNRIAFWRSHPDQGQASAINEGFSLATGAILCWLNSDDLYVPGTLHAVAATLGPRLHEAVVLYGGCEVFRDGRRWREFRPAIPFVYSRLQITDFIDQPSTFWTRPVWEKVGPLDASLHYAFDWDWFLRAGRVCTFVAMDQYLSRYRVHPAHKSKTGRGRRWEELVEVVRRYAPAEIYRHYDFLTRHSLARLALNSRMRIAQALRRLWPSSASDALATALYPPFWLLPPGIKREILWEISGIR